MYDKEGIRVYALNGKDTTFSSIRFTTNGAGQDSTLQVELPANSKTFYLRLNMVDTDTLTVEYQLINSECCKYIHTIKRLVYNNLPELPAGSETKTIRK